MASGKKRKEKQAQQNRRRLHEARRRAKNELREQLGIVSGATSPVPDAGGVTSGGPGEVSAPVPQEPIVNLPSGATLDFRRLEDLQLATRAINERWDVEKELRPEFCKVAGEVYRDKTIDLNIRMTAGRLILTADKMNLEQEKLELEREKLTADKPATGNTTNIQINQYLGAIDRAADADLDRLEQKIDSLLGLAAPGKPETVQSQDTKEPG